MFIFTPKGRNFAYEYFERANQDKTGDWMCSLLKASQSGLIDPNELLKAHESMPERLFAQEFECSFLEDASSVFHGVEDCISGNLEPPVQGHRYVMGVDLGRTNDFTVLCVIDIGTNKIVAFQRFGDCAWSLQKERIVLMAKQYNNAHIEMDATGFSAGSVIAEDLMTHPYVEDLKLCQLSVSPFKFTNQSKKALVEKLTVAIEQRLITYPKIDDLVSELKSFTYEMSDFGNIRYTAPEGLHDDCVMSLGLAVWALGSYIYAPIRKDRFISPRQSNFHSISSM
jgi:phage FluMu gp28-like protein